MISFDLRCAGGHVFEVWFRSSADYEGQRTGGHILCPICGDHEVEKAVMAPAVGAKGNRRTVQPAPQRDNAVPMTMPGETGAEAGPDERIRALVSALAQAQAEALKSSQWVGGSFAEKARSMHYGEIDHAPIHGTTSPQEARAMLEEGVAVAPLLVPIAPPDQSH